jgi:hypothetical protein
MRRQLLAVLLLMGGLTVAACGDDSPSPGATTPPGATPSATAPPTTQGNGGSPATTSSPKSWSSGPVTVTRNVTVPPVPVLVGIRSAAHTAEGYDRIVFDFRGPLPGYEVRYVSQVIADASGQVLAMPGRRYLQIIFRPAQAHDDTGTAIAGRHDLTYPMLKGYVVAGDFEAVLTIALGLDDTVGFRIGELPGRIYVDVAA